VNLVQIKQKVIDLLLLCPDEEGDQAKAILGVIGDDLLENYVAGAPCSSCRFTELDSNEPPCDTCEHGGDGGDMNEWLPQEEKLEKNCATCHNFECDLEDWVCAECINQQKRDGTPFSHWSMPENKQVDPSAFAGSLIEMLAKKYPSRFLAVSRSLRKSLGIV